MITAIVLAAGESRRMQTPKALLKIGNETFAECIARKCNEAGIHVIYIVTGVHREEIQQQMQGKYQVDFIFNFRYPEGQLSSLKEGLRNLPTGSTAALVWPVDQPLVRVEQEIGACLDRTGGPVPAAPCGRCIHAVRDHDSAETEVAAQEPRDDRPREERRDVAVVERRVSRARDHDEPHARIDAALEREQVTQQSRALRPDHYLGGIGIGRRVTEPREVLGRGRHAAGLQSSREGRGQ